MRSTKGSHAASSVTPAFRELSRAESDEVLKRNHVGRVAFTFHDHVDIEPVHYVYAEGWLHGRTAPGAKIAVLRHHPWVAFEVDEVKGLFDWCSVIVHGAVDIPDENGSALEREAYAKTLGYVRTLVPEAMHSADPSPGRVLAFRIHVDLVTGRLATTNP